MALAQFMSEVAERIGTVFKGGTRRKDVPDFTWDHLIAARMLEGEFEFCGEPFFLTWLRSHLVGLVQFGWMREYAIVVRDGSALAEDVKGHLTELARSTLGKCVRIHELARRLKNGGLEFEVGVLGETAASSECMRHLAAILEPDKLLTKSSEKDLRKWLHSRSDTAIAVCDLIVADSLEKDLRAEYPKQVYLSYRDTEVLRVPFSKPLPVGVPYPAGDRQWRRILANAFLDVLKEHPGDWGMEGAGSIVTVHYELSQAGISVFSEATLYERLLLDIEFKEACLYNKLTASSGTD